MKRKANEHTKKIFSNPSTALFVQYLYYQNIYWSHENVIHYITELTSPSVPYCKRCGDYKIFRMYFLFPVPIFFYLIECNRQAAGSPDDKWLPSPTDICNTRRVAIALPTSKKFYNYFYNLLLPKKMENIHVIFFCKFYLDQHYAYWFVNSSNYFLTYTSLRVYERDI